MSVILCTTQTQGCYSSFPYVPYELFTSSCLQEFEPRPNPISGSGLAPIGILVSNTKTPTAPRSQRGHVCVHGLPSKSSVRHASHGAKALQNRTELEGDTLSERGLMESGGTRRCCTQNLTTKSSKMAACERPASALCCPQTHE